MSAQIISFAAFQEHQKNRDARRAEEQQVEIDNKIANFDMYVTGSMPFDNLDDLIEDLQEEGLEVDCYIFDPKEVEDPVEHKVPKTADNDTTATPGDSI